jgi:2-iminobutanoate/2-iminopropanoate deaminase
MSIEVINPGDSVEPIGSYSPAVKAAGIIFTSGQVGVDPSTNQVPDNFREEVSLAIDNLDAVLLEGGSSLDHVVRVQCLLSDMANFQIMDEVYGERFSKPFPARFTHGTALSAGYRIEIIATAITKS